MSARSSLRPPARHPQADPEGLDEQQPQPHRAGDASPAGPVLLRTKLRPPPVRDRLIPRPRLDALLEAGSGGDCA